MLPLRARNLQLVKRLFSQKSGKIETPNKSKEASSDGQINTNVAGLTSYVMRLLLTQKSI